MLIKHFEPCDHIQVFNFTLSIIRLNYTHRRYGTFDACKRDISLICIPQDCVKLCACLITSEDK